MTLRVGSIVELKVSCLNNPKGSRGICYELYTLETPVASIIFENGECCGFSKEEQAIFLNL